MNSAKKKTKSKKHVKTIFSFLNHYKQETTSILMRQNIIIRCIVFYNRPMKKKNKLSFLIAHKSILHEKTSENYVSPKKQYFPKIHLFIKC